MDSPIELSIASAIANLRTNPQLSLRTTAIAYNIPRTTLQRRYHGLSSTRQNARQIQQLLSPKQEAELVRWIIALEKAGNVLNYAQFKEIVVQISTLSGGLNTVCNN